MPVWGPERPLTLVWIAVDDGVGGRALLGANEAAQFGTPTTPQRAELLTTVRADVVAAADERGLPIAWPLLDLEDLNAVTFTDVWGGFDDRIVAASTRYRADAVLIGRVRPGIFGNEVEWLFVRGVERQALPVAAVRDGLDVAADRYAAELATVGGANVTLLTVLEVLTRGRLRPRHELSGTAERARKRRRRVVRRRHAELARRGSRRCARAPACVGARRCVAAGGCQRRARLADVRGRGGRYRPDELAVRAERHLHRANVARRAARLAGSSKAGSRRRCSCSSWPASPTVSTAYLAKRFDWRTRLGGLLDPAADKLLLVSTFAALSYVGLDSRSR